MTTSRPVDELLHDALRPAADLSAPPGLLAAVMSGIADEPAIHAVPGPRASWSNGATWSGRGPGVRALQLAAALMLLLLAWAALIAQRQPPTPTTLRNGEVLFLRGGDLWRVGPDGASQEPVTTTPELDEGPPAWSPDGRHVAFITRPTDGRLPTIEVMSASGEGRRPIYPAGQPLPSGHLSWSPDGQWIVFAEERAGKPHLAAVSVDGAETRIYDTGKWAALDPVWSPDGRWIAAVPRGHAGSNGEVLVIAADGSGYRAWPTEHSGIGGSAAPIWTPDSMNLILDHAQSGNRWISSVRVADGAYRRITRQGAGAFAPRLSPDGSRIAFARELGGGCGSETRVMAADGSGEKTLLRRAFPVGWSPAGDEILAFDLGGPDRPGGRGMVAIDPESGADRVLAAWTPQDIVARGPGFWCGGEGGWFEGVAWRGIAE